MLAILLGVLLANFHEWWIHKYILHRLGKKRNSTWHFHWVHHRRVRGNEGYDPTYYKEGYFKEKVSLFILALLHAPLFWVSPLMAKTLGVYLLAYYFIHMRSHIDPEWAKKWVPWHYDHHMGKDQDKNWCIVLPICDIILGTRKKYF
jgi:sterol desaturase/sphingolipid hydroxylase (fatty acid hydroxylase superfamily)